MENKKSLLETTCEKVKVTEAEIVVHGTKEKPYFEIKYREFESGECHLGCGSYNLDFVFEWLNEFEIMNCSTCRHNGHSPSHHPCDVCMDSNVPYYKMWEKKNGL